MRVAAVCVGRPRAVRYRDRAYETAIFKTPVSGPVLLGRLNLEGDAQANLKTHGGPDMAVYAYPLAHYPFWESDLGGAPLPMGAFGENLTLEGEGLTESDLCIGDTLAIGETRLQISEPRTPCHKLAMKFDDPDLPRRFARQGTVGYYFRVLREGRIAAGDSVAIAARDPRRISVAEVLSLWADKGADPAALERMVALDPLSESWKGRFRARLSRSEGQGQRGWSDNALSWE